MASLESPDPMLIYAAQACRAQRIPLTVWLHGHEITGFVTTMKEALTLPRKNKDEWKSVTDNVVFRAKVRGRARQKDILDTARERDLDTLGPWFLDLVRAQPGFEPAAEGEGRRIRILLSAVSAWSIEAELNDTLMEIQLWPV